MNTSFSSWPHSPIMPPVSAEDMEREQKDKQKKPRHRHSPTQLAALNELFEKNEHPTLAERTALAGELAMEVKTVNAWFQNKRASSKKRPRTGTAYEPVDPEPPRKVASIPAPQHHTDEEDFYSHMELPRSARAQSHDPLLDPRFFSGHADSNNPFTESEPAPRRMRMRPSVEQTEELRKLYSLTAHPTKEEREELGERIGMKYQSITNWFQNQRSIAKKKREEDGDVDSAAYDRDGSQEPRPFPAYPPAAQHPSLSALMPPSSHPSLPSSLGPRARRSQSPRGFTTRERWIPRKPPVQRRYSTPYSSSSPSMSRPRRTRPEPHQLEALKKLFKRTQTPSIEERSALALEIGMDVGKVTNWFRNLRQTERKRSKRTAADDDGEHDGFDDAYDRQAYSTSASRDVSPSIVSSSGSSRGGRRRRIDMDVDSLDPHHSDYDSEDDYQEAVTPSPESSPPPPPSTLDSSPARRRSTRTKTNLKVLNMVMDGPGRFKKDGKSITPTEDDARLLLSFHEAVVN